MLEYEALAGGLDGFAFEDLSQFYAFFSFRKFYTVTLFSVSSFYCYLVFTLCHDISNGCSI